MGLAHSAPLTPPSTPRHLPYHTIVNSTGTWKLLPGVLHCAHFHTMLLVINQLGIPTFVVGTNRSRSGYLSLRRNINDFNGTHMMP